MENTANLVEFDDQDNYYMCKSCKTHIALEQDFYCVHLDTQVSGPIFNKAVNVRVNEAARHYQVDDGHTVGDIYCVKCDDKLGCKYIQIKEGGSMIVHNEMVKLNLKKILKNQGHQIFDPETNEAVVQNVALVELDEGPNTKLFMCKYCSTHIALAQDFFYVSGGNEPGGTVFYKVVNLKVDEAARHYQVDAGHTVADVYCMKCDANLGWKYIQVAADHIVPANDMVKIHPYKLLGKKGDVIYDAETNEPLDPAIVSARQILQLVEREDSTT